MLQRPRILRKNRAIRELISETILSPNDLVAPIFIIEGENKKEEIPSLPNYFRYSIDKAIEEVKILFSLGIKSILLFAKCEDHLKDILGTEATNQNGLMQRAIREIRSACPDIYIMTDVALDPYSISGHDGIVENEEILNDKTVEVLSQMALTHALSGADMVAPSDMMDGRIAAIRTKLEEAELTNVGILAYSAKYASCFYGPFRDVLNSNLSFGDKKTYQMDPRNRLEAIREVELDISEGADIVMVKPALSYLDIIREIKNRFNVPVCAYHVSGEYSMIKAASEKGWLNEKDAILETTTSIKRAGADIIITYFAKDLISLID
ncbi:MAG: porphobilinogen synthase [Leptospiraceae bacterium]|nr:porphobilinogen synthase [Leptospiraceae bacterium]